MAQPSHHTHITHTDRQTDRHTHTKISQFEIAMLRNEKVLWFEISVEYSPLVDVVQSP